MLTRLLTGHCSLKYYLHKIGKVEDHFCAEETEHILCRRFAACQRKLTYMEKAIYNTCLLKLKEMFPKAILKFINSFNLF